MVSAKELNDMKKTRPVRAGYEMDDRFEVWFARWIEPRASLQGPEMHVDGDFYKRSKIFERYVVENAAFKEEGLYNFGKFKLMLDKFFGYVKFYSSTKPTVDGDKPRTYEPIGLKRAAPQVKADDEEEAEDKGQAEADENATNRTTT